MGGEKSSVRVNPPENHGSPPRGRGKVAAVQAVQQGVGITPAWAGKRELEPAHLCNDGDHPRVGGEKACMAVPPGSSLGSPPRGRGKDAQAQQGAAGAGITPAWAGKSSALLSCAKACEDHPRVGGEKLGFAPVKLRLPGSPPRGRGKVLNFNGISSPPRITPAWAGKRRTSGIPLIAIRDHPRVGGEKTSKPWQM